MADFNNLLLDLDQEKQEREENDASDTDIFAEVVQGSINDSIKYDDHEISQQNYVPSTTNTPAALLREQILQRQGIYNISSVKQEDSQQYHADFRYEDALLEELGGYQVQPNHIPDENYELLKRLWTQELNCPELLPYNCQLMELLMGVHSSQNEIRFHLKSKFSENSNIDLTLASIASGVCKMDMDRLSFMLSDLLRMRIEKIENYWMNLVMDGGGGEDAGTFENLSEAEKEYLRSYGALYSKHMQRSVTNNFPKDAWKKINEAEMIERPNLDAFVFCKVLFEDGITIDNSIDIDGQDDDEENGTPMNTFHEKGTQLFVRYRAVKGLIFDGKVELLI